MKKKKYNVYFTECEHEEDLHNYTSDIIKSGAELVSYSTDFDAETANVLIEVNPDNYDEFINAFKQTDSFGFSSLNNQA